jgi:hypothetical protein
MEIFFIHDFLSLWHSVLEYIWNIFYCLTLGAGFEYQLESAWIFFNFLTNFGKLFLDFPLMDQGVCHVLEIRRGIYINMSTNYMNAIFLITWYRCDAHIQHILAPPSMSTFRMSELTNPRDRWSHHCSDGLDQSKEV